MKKHIIRLFIVSCLLFSAGSAHAAIDVLVSEEITMNSDGKTVEMDISDLNITNRSSDVRLSLDSVSAFEANPEWELVADTTDFVNMAVNQHKYSLSADGHDLNSGPYFPEKVEISPGATRKIALSGKTGTSSDHVKNKHVCNIIVTVSAVDTNAPDLIVTAPSGMSRDTPEICVTGSTYVVKGKAYDSESGIAAVTVNGTAVTLESDGSWNASIILSSGDVTEITVTAADNAGRTATEVRYVKYLPNCTISFYADGGQVNPSTMQVTNGGTYRDLPVPTRSGYRFVGWYSDTPAKYDRTLSYKDHPWLFYADSFADAYDACGYNEEALQNHYMRYGYAEGRRTSQYVNGDTVFLTGDTVFYALWVKEPSSYAIFSETDGSLTVYKNLDTPAAGDIYRDKVVTAIATDVEIKSVWNNGNAKNPFYNYADKVKSVTIADPIAPVNTSYWFYNFKNCEYYNLKLLNTANVTNMKSMFYYNLHMDDAFEDISSWVVDQVTDMYGMFYYAGADVWDIDLSGWNVSAVTNMSYMFYSLDSPKINIDMSGWKCSALRTMSNMFYAAGNDVSSSLVLNFTGIETPSLTNLTYTFAQTNAKEIQFIDLDDLDTSSVTDMNNMFSGIGGKDYPELINIGSLNSWDTSNVKNMRRMFYDIEGNSKCSFLLDVSQWDTSSVTNMSGMFGMYYSNRTTYYSVQRNNMKAWSAGDLSRKIVNQGTPDEYVAWDTSKVINMEDMFTGCGGKTAAFNLGDIGTWDVSSVQSFKGMFYEAGYSASDWYIGDLSRWNTESATDMTFMFRTAARSDSDFEPVDMSGWNVSGVTSFNGFNTGSESKFISPNFAAAAEMNESAEISDFIEETSSAEDALEVFCLANILVEW